MSSNLDRRFPGTDIPDPLRGVLLSFAWDLAKLFALDLPIATVPIEPLEWQLDLPWWRDGDALFAVTPNEVLAQPDRYPAQWERTRRAELSAPVHVRKTDRGTIMIDGVHRLLRSVILERSVLLARFVPDDALALIRS